VRSRPAFRVAIRALAMSGTALLALAVAAAPARADATTHFKEVDLVSDQAGHAPLVDPSLKNAWGLALSPTSPLWVANNHTDTSTLYAGGVNGATPTKVPLTVAVVGGPTGQAFNDTNGFVVTGTNGSGPARFLFATESGDIAGWSPAATPTAAVVAAHVDGAIYKGLALLHSGNSAFLLAADFRNNRVDVFNSAFARVPGLSHKLRDPRLPKGYAPFNVFTSGRAIYVAYAKQGPEFDEVAGAGLGFVDVYERLGDEPERIASHGTLNAPWGMAIAPASFGRFAGALLVGNFGDGRIGAYRDDDFIGLLRDGHGKPISIDGLWALLPGTAATGGTSALWFSAGPNEEVNGLVGEILPG
jgi:uncharacterized protein (TIGR03118 family)